MKDLIVDFTDLIARLSQSPVVTGIQRVVIAIGGAALEAGARAAAFDAAQSTWSILPTEPLQRLLAMTSMGATVDDVAWTRALNELAASRPATSPPFPPATILVTLGAPWDNLNALRSIRVLRRVHGLRYAAFVHDTVPIDFPEWCENDTPARFRDWLYGCLGTADVLIVNSDATAACIERVCREIDFVCPPVVRCPLGAVTPSYDVPCPSAGIRHILCRPYVLFVATLEPRKNHLGVVAAWRTLLFALGTDAPLLVFAGAEGWRAELVIKALGDPRLDGKIVVLTNVTEDDLASLYRNCVFTIYNSLWEGWGLPVTESIAHGKVPVVPAHSGLLESGAGHAEYFPPDDAAMLAQRLVRLVRDGNYRLARTSSVASAVLRTWSEIAGDLAESLRGLPVRHDQPSAPRLKADTPYRFSIPAERESLIGFRNAAVAETLQATGWYSREGWGTWTSASTFTMVGRWRDDDAIGDALPHDLAIHLAVRGHHDDCDLHVRTGGGIVLGIFKVQAHRDVLLSFRWPASEGEVVDLIFDQSRLTNLGRSCNDDRVIGIGVMSLMLGRDGDPTARCRFYESILSSKDVIVLKS